MIRFTCPGCQSIYNVPDDKGGKTGKCPKCQSQFTIPMPEAGAVAAAPPPPLPPPPPPPPANDFAFGGGDEEEVPQEEDRPRKKKSKAEIDGDEDAPPPPTVKDSPSVADDDEFEDDDRSSRKKSLPAKGQGLSMAAGIIHLIFASFIMSAGMQGINSGSYLSSATNTVPYPSHVTTDPGFRQNKDLSKQGQKLSDQLENLNTFAKISQGVGGCNIIVGLVAIGAGIGCIMRKPLGKWLSLVVGPLAVILKFFSLVVLLVLISSEFRSMTTLGVDAAILLVYVVYAAFTIFASMKGIPGKPRAAKAAKIKAKVDDEDDEEEEAPAPKKGKKKVVEEDDEDEPKPRKSKKKRRQDDDDD